MPNLTRAELATLKNLVGLALENKGSGIVDLTNEHREALYVIFAKLLGAMEAESETDGEVERPADRDWPAGGRLISG